MHLGLDRLMQRPLGLGEDFRGDVGAEVARLRIDGLILLFNPDAEAWPVHLLIPLPPAPRPSLATRLSWALFLWRWQPLHHSSRSETRSSDTPERGRYAAWPCAPLVTLRHPQSSRNFPARPSLHQRRAPDS